MIRYSMSTLSASELETRSPFPLAPSGLGWILRRPVLLRAKCVYAE
jgi:hypothetical protein